MKVVHFFGVLTFCAVLWSAHNIRATNAKRIALVPLSGDEVYRMLYATGHEDDIPEGRVVTQGIAAVSGFALGFTKALGGALLYDVVTANVTGLLSGLSGGSTSTTTTTQPQEICFNTRSARSLDEAETIADAYMRMGAVGGESGDKAKVRSSSSNERENTKSRRNRRRKMAKGKGKNNTSVKKGSLLGTMTGSGTAPTATTGNTATTGTAAPTGTAANTGTWSFVKPTIANTGTWSFVKPTFNFVASSPSTQSTNPSGTSATNTNSGLGTGTTSVTTTSAAKPSSTNCIVIQK